MISFDIFDKEKSTLKKESAIKAFGDFKILCIFFLLLSTVL